MITLALLAISAMLPPQSPALSLVVAETERQYGPRPVPCDAGGCGDSYYRAWFDPARAIAGVPLPSSFEAQLRLHTPFISRTTLALIVARQPDGALRVLRRAGFNGRTGVACFREPGEPSVDWKPQGPQIRSAGDTLCVFDPTQIEPSAPRPQ
jgi:hypothetical protein